MSAFSRRRLYSPVRYGLAPLQVLDYTEGLEGEEAVVAAEEADAAPVQEV